MIIINSRQWKGNAIEGACICIMYDTPFVRTWSATYLHIPRIICEKASYAHFAAMDHPIQHSHITTNRNRTTYLRYATWGRCEQCVAQQIWNVCNIWSDVVWRVTLPTWRTPYASSRFVYSFHLDTDRDRPFMHKVYASTVYRRASKWKVGVTNESLWCVCCVCGTLELGRIHLSLDTWNSRWITDVDKFIRVDMHQHLVDSRARWWAVTISCLTYEVWPVLSRSDPVCIPLWENNRFSSNDIRYLQTEKWKRFQLHWNYKMLK